MEIYATERGVSIIQPETVTVSLSEDDLGETHILVDGDASLVILEAYDDNTCFVSVTLSLQEVKDAAQALGLI